MHMKKQNELALIVAYYLSKYDRIGVQNLGYRSFNDAYRDVEKKLGVKSTSLKNRRDEFDPIHSNARVGWYQRPMSPSRVRVAELFSSLSEPALRGIVRDIIEGKGEVTQTFTEISRSTAYRNGRKKKFILRGPTGKKLRNYLSIISVQGKAL